MVLVRSHFEAAAMAAYCLDRLTDAARQDQPSALNDLIPRTLFGTGLIKHRDNDSIADLVTMCEGDTIRICRAVDSLDRFYFQEVSQGKLAVVYSLLCDYAHPNHRGVLDFMHSAERQDGWLISYTKGEPPNPENAGTRSRNTPGIHAGWLRCGLEENATVLAILTERRRHDRVASAIGGRHSASSGALSTTSIRWWWRLTHRWSGCPPRRALTVTLLVVSPRTDFTVADFLV